MATLWGAAAHLPHRLERPGPSGRASPVSKAQFCCQAGTAQAGRASRGTAPRISGGVRLAATAQLIGTGMVCGGKRVEPRGFGRQAPRARGDVWRVCAYKDGVAGKPPGVGGASDADDAGEWMNSNKTAWEEWVAANKSKGAGADPQEQPGASPLCGMIEDAGNLDDNFMEPFHDFQDVCALQLELAGDAMAREIALAEGRPLERGDEEADAPPVPEPTYGIKLVVFARTPASFKSGKLELQRIAAWPAGEAEDGEHVLSESAAIGLSSRAEGCLVDEETVLLPGCGSLVLPMARGGCLMGLVVAERDDDEERDSWRGGGWEPLFPMRAEAVLRKTAQCLAGVCAMEQRTLMSQWYAQQRGIAVDSVVAQVRAPLMALRTMGSMLLGRGLVKEGEPGRDMVQGMMDQGDRLSQVVEQLQEALFPTRAGAAGRLPGAMSMAPRRPQLPGLPPPYPPARARAAGAPVAAEEQVGEEGEELELVLRPIRRLVGAEGGEEGLSDGELEVVDGIAHCRAEDVLRPILSAAGQLAEQRGVTILRPDMPARLPPIAADDHTLRQALSNAVDEALGRTPRGGVLSVAVENPGAGVGEARTVLIRVEDSGPALDELQRADALTLRDQGQGVGQKLAIARLLVEGMGGELKITDPAPGFWALAGGGGEEDDAEGGGGNAVEILLPTLSPETAAILAAAGRIEPEQQGGLGAPGAGGPRPGLVAGALGRPVALRRPAKRPEHESALDKAWPH